MTEYWDRTGRRVGMIKRIAAGLTGPSGRPRILRRPSLRKETTMFDLTGKCALVTGASGGIGADIARILHAAGATWACPARAHEPLQALAAELGERAHVLPCNLSDPEAVEGLVKRGIEAMGSVDILVNNAGITKDGLAMRMSDDDWQSVIDVNLTATFRCAVRDPGNDEGALGPDRQHLVVVGTTGNAGHVNYAAPGGMVGSRNRLRQRSPAGGSR